MSTTEPTETTPTEWSPPENPPPTLFANGATFELTRPIEMEQLTDEITKATKRQVTLAMSGPINGTLAISLENPATLAVQPGNVDAAKVQQAIDGHVPVAGYAVPDSEKRYAQAVQNMIDDPNYEPTAEEQVDLLRGLVVRSLSTFPG